MSKGKTVVVLVKPGSRRGPAVVPQEDGTLTVCVPEQPIQGRATRATALVLAKHFGVPKSQVRLLSGASSRFKRFQIG